MVVVFENPGGVFLDVPADGENLIVRPKDIQDSATPSGNALACEALLKLHALTDREPFRAIAEEALTVAADAALRYPTGFACWLSTAEFASNNGPQIAILWNTSAEEAKSMLEYVRANYKPNAVVAASADPPDRAAPQLLMDRPLRNGKTTAYVCEHFVCKQPVNTLDALRSLL